MDKKIRELNELTSGNVEAGDFLEIQETDQDVSKKITVEVLNELEASARAAQDDVIEAGIGANANGTYNQPVGTYYLDSTTSVMNALEVLDGVINSISNLEETYVTLDADDMHACFVSPVQIIAAPGANYITEIISAVGYNNYDSDPFAIGAGGKLVLQYNGGASHLLEWTESFIEATSDTIERGAFTSNVEMLANTKVEATTTLAVTNDAGDDGEITIYVLYRNLLYKP